MKYFNQLMLNDTLFEVSGYFNEAKQVLVVKCREFLSVVKSWRYEEVLIQKLELMKGMSETLAGRVSISELAGLSMREI